MDEVKVEVSKGRIQMDEVKVKIDATTPIEVTNEVKVEVCNGKIQVDAVKVKINAKEVAMVVMVGVVAGKVVSFVFKKLFGGGGGAPPAPAN